MPCQNVNTINIVHRDLKCVQDCDISEIQIDSENYCVRYLRKIRKTFFRSSSERFGKQTDQPLGENVRLLFNERQSIVHFKPSPEKKMRKIYRKLS